jgi:dihydroorotate dehydrogenase
MCEDLHRAGHGCVHWHGVELNLSCPNVAEGGHDFGSDPDTVAACVAAARAALPDRALIAKLTPNVAPTSRRWRSPRRDGGADAVPPSTPCLGLDVDLRTGQPVLPRRFGGYSGPAILPIALAKVDEIVRGAGVPVVGVGGIEGADGRAQVLRAGARWRCRWARPRCATRSPRRGWRETCGAAYRWRVSPGRRRPRRPRRLPRR